MTDYNDINNQLLTDFPNEDNNPEEWSLKCPGIQVAFRHPSGFFVFIKREELEGRNEYRDGDPYSVLQNFNNSFLRRRLICTLSLIEDLHRDDSVRLLDLGCGEGHFTNEIKKKFSNFEIFGIDHSLSAIDYAHTNYSGITFITADAYQPPFPDVFFDIVVCNHVWEHLSDPMNMLKAIRKILKPGGVLIVATPSRYRISNLLRVLLGKQVSLMSKHNVTEYSVGQIHEQLIYGGFIINRSYSMSIKESGWILNLLKSLLMLWIRLTKSPHILEATAFYSASKP